MKILDNPQVREAFAWHPADYTTNPCGGFKESGGHLRETECDFSGRCHVHEQQWREAVLTALLGALAEQGERLDFEAAHKEMWATILPPGAPIPDGEETHGISPGMQRHLDRQHRAVVGALQQRIAELEGRGRCPVKGCVETLPHSHYIPVEAP